MDEQIEKQQERIQTLASKLIEIETNYEALSSLCDQIHEEIAMGEEDVAARTLKKVELVTLREDLEAVYDRSYHTYGNEFPLFVQQINSNEPDQYQAAKLLTFLRETLCQLQS